MKKTFSLIFAVIMTMILTIPVSAMDQNTAESTITIFSPDFPNAYIITDTTPSNCYVNDPSTTYDTITATVFVEENYDIIDGEAVITDSRLLSKEEVLAIGVDNFDDLSPASTASSQTKTNSRGKLSLTFSSSCNSGSNGVSCKLVGSANWGRSVIYNGETNPAIGDDFMGVTWSGAFTASDEDFGVFGTNQRGETLDIYLTDSVPNAGRVWSFAEYENHTKYETYADEIDFDMIISKNTLEGNGNTAEAVLKYIHTYSAVKGSITITPGQKTTTGSFSLSNTEKQWSLVCTITDIPY